MSLIEKYLGEAKIDDWLKSKGWKETHGIALYTNKKHPLIGIDTNSGEASVKMFSKPQNIFNTSGDFLDYTNKPSDIENSIKQAEFAIKLGDAVKKLKLPGEVSIRSSSIDFFGKIKRYEGGKSFTIWIEDYPKKINLVLSTGLKDDKKTLKGSTSINTIIKTIKDFMG